MTDLTNLNYLEKYLQVHGIKYERIDKEEIFDRERHIAQCERHQIIVPCRGDDFQWDVICHKGSYGYDKGLLEIYGNIVDEEKDDDSVVGWLTAQDVIARIQAKDAIELLKKEQGSSEPMQLQYSKEKEEYWWYESICPSCGCHWITGDNKEQCFCPHCGQKVIDMGIDS